MPPNFSEYHPIHIRRAAEWAEAYDFYRSGRHVLDPGRPVGRVGMIVPTDVPVDADRGKAEAPPRRMSRFEWTPVESYIWSHAREHRDSYRTRSARAVHIPVFRHHVDTWSSSALRIEPKRGDGSAPSEPWATYWSDVDRQGTTVSAFNRQALTMALVFGLEFAFTDIPWPLAPILSRADEDAQGIRAYSYLVNPPHVRNWRLNEVGEPLWMVVDEEEPDTRAPGDPWPEERRERVRVWYPDHWEIWRTADPQEPGLGDNGPQWEIVDEGPHGAGKVPVSVLYARRSHDGRHSMDSDSMLGGVVRQDRNIFNLLSMWHEIMVKQGFSILAIPTDDMGGPEMVSVGPENAMLFRGENGTPQMLSPDAALLIAYERAIGWHLQAAKETSGLGRGKSEYSKEERSGDALRVESRNERNGVASLADAVEEFDHQHHGHVAALHGLDDFPLSEYSRNVTLDSLGREIDEALKLSKLRIPMAAMIEVAKPLVARFLRERGVSDTDIDKAMEAVEDGLEEKMMAAPNALQAADADGKKDQPQAGAKSNGGD